MVTVVTEDGDEPDPEEQEDEDASWAVASGEDAIMISVDAAGAVGFLVGTTTGRWLRRSSCGPPPRGGAAPVEEGTSSGGIRVGLARRNVLVLRACGVFVIQKARGFRKRWDEKKETIEKRDVVVFLTF